jgi:hypothetical protein
MFLKEFCSFYKVYIIKGICRDKTFGNWYTSHCIYLLILLVILLGEASLEKLNQIFYCKRHYESMKKINKQKFNIMALSNGRPVPVSIDRHYDILVRILLLLFAKEPDGFALHNQAFRNASMPGFMKVNNESLITEDLARIMERNPEVSTC